MISAKMKLKENTEIKNNKQKANSTTDIKNTSKISSRKSHRQGSERVEREASGNRSKGKGVSQFSCWSCSFNVTPGETALW